MDVCAWDTLPKTLVRASRIEVDVYILPEYASQMVLTENESTVETLTSNTTRKAVTDGIQVSRPGRNGHNIDSRTGSQGRELGAKPSIFTYEIHWDKSANDIDTIEATALENWTGSTLGRRWTSLVSMRSLATCSPFNPDSDSTFVRSIHPAATTTLVMAWLCGALALPACAAPSMSTRVLFDPERDSTNGPVLKVIGLPQIHISNTCLGPDGIFVLVVQHVGFDG